MRDQSILDRISHDAKIQMLATMPASVHSEHIRFLLSDPNFQIFYHAPVLIVISAMAEGPWIVEDCSLAAENLMLAARDIGLRYLLDRFRAELPQHTGGKKRARASCRLGAGCADYRRLPKSTSAARLAKRARNPLGWLSCAGEFERLGHHSADARSGNDVDFCLLCPTGDVRVTAGLPGQAEVPLLFDS